MKRQYKVVEEVSNPIDPSDQALIAFSLRVEGWLELGWELHGPLVVNNWTAPSGLAIQYVQALTRG